MTVLMNKKEKPNIKSIYIHVVFIRCAFNIYINIYIIKSWTWNHGPGTWTWNHGPGTWTWNHGPGNSCH